MLECGLKPVVVISNTAGGVSFSEFQTDRDNMMKVERSGFTYSNLREIVRWMRVTKFDTSTKEAMTV